MRCWFSAACQETILPLLRQIPRDFHSICNHEWDWMGLGSTSNQRLKNNRSYIITEAYSADLLRQLQEDTIISFPRCIFLRYSVGSWQGDCSSAWTMLHCHNGWKMHPDLDLSNTHPIYPIQDPQTATSSQTLRGVQKSPTKMPTSTGKGSVCFMTAGLQENVKGKNNVLGFLNMTPSTSLAVAWTWWIELNQ